MDTYGQYSCIELTKSGTFNNCPHYGMRQSWRAGYDNPTDYVIDTSGVDFADRYTKMSICDGSNGLDPCTELMSTFNKLDANDISVHTTNAKAYINDWGQKVKNVGISIRDCLYFIDTVVGGGKIDNAWIYSAGTDSETGKTIYKVHNTSYNDDQVRFGTDCRANITTFANCFYKQKGIVYNSNYFDTPDLSPYTSLIDISRMYYGTQVSYLTSSLLSLPYSKNTNDPENLLDWSEFIGNGDVKMERNALMNISYRIDNISMIQPTVYEFNDSTSILNTNANAGYLDILSILCPVKEDGSNIIRNGRGKVVDVSYDPVDINNYIPFTRIKSISNFYIYNNQYVDYSNLFKLCTSVRTLSNFLNCDLTKARIDGIMRNCTSIESIVESFNHTGNVNDLNESRSSSGRTT